MRTASLGLLALVGRVANSSSFSPLSVLIPGNLCIALEVPSESEFQHKPW